MKSAPNNFYSGFDFECLEGTRTDDYRTPFEVDRDRIIHSAAFRRLQSKTQVFLSGEYDFYRTRLTHSLEVAQIGRSICTYLRRNSPLLGEDFYIDADLVEGICLSHDLGHPPFGHSGERILNALMKTHGGFEGNAQTLRLVTEIVFSANGERKGMNPTRAFLDGVLKYKSLHGQLRNPENHFLYDEQKPYVKFVFGGSTAPSQFKPGVSLNAFRSIECQIMDWSDDAAYSINDLVDGIHAGFITKQRIEQWATEENLKDHEAGWMTEVLKAIGSGDLERRFARTIGSFIKACSLTGGENFMSGKTNRYKMELHIDPEVKRQSSLYKKLSFELVFLSPQLHQLEHKGGLMVRRIFETLVENYVTQPNSKLNLLPAGMEKTIRATKNKHDRFRLICDHIAGMTDGFAVRMYKRLFEPDFGSIVDLI